MRMYEPPKILLVLLWILAHTVSSRVRLTEAAQWSVDRFSKSMVIPGAVARLSVNAFDLHGCMGNC